MTLTCFFKVTKNEILLSLKPRELTHKYNMTKRRRDILIPVIILFNIIMHKRSSRWLQAFFNNSFKVANILSHIYIYIYIYIYHIYIYIYIYIYSPLVQCSRILMQCYPISSDADVNLDANPRLPYDYQLFCCHIQAKYDENIPTIGQ